MKILIGNTYTNRMTGRKVIVRSISGHDVIFFINGKRNSLRIREFRHFYTDKSYKEIKIEKLNENIANHETCVRDYQENIDRMRIELAEWESGARDNQTWQEDE